VRQRAQTLPSRMVPTPLARFRYIDARLFVPHCASIDSALGQSDPSGERFQLSWQGNGPMRFERRACRWFEPPFADGLRVWRRGQVSGVRAELALDEWLGVPAANPSKPPISPRSATALQQGWRFTAPGLHRLRRCARSLPPSKKRNLAIQARCCPVAGIHALRSGSGTLRANARLLDWVGASFGYSRFLLLAAVFTAAPLALLALRCSPALWPLGCCAILGYGQRSFTIDSSRTASNTLAHDSNCFFIGPLPCPAPSDAIRAPRPSFRRSSMPAVPSASNSFHLANGDRLSASSPDASC
jgi:hypothetical protein